MSIEVSKRKTDYRDRLSGLVNHLPLDKIKSLNLMFMLMFGLVCVQSCYIHIDLEYVKQMDIKVVG